MKKLLLLISLSLFLGLSIHAKEDIQALCKDQREKVDEMVKVISTIQDQSIKDYLHQVWINPILEMINKQSENNEKHTGLKFLVYYNSGLTIAFKKVDERRKEAQNKYDALLDFEKMENDYPSAPVFIKEGSYFKVSPLLYPQLNYFAFDYSPDKLFVPYDIGQEEYTPKNTNDDNLHKYTIKDLRSYLQEYVDCTQVTKEGETIALTDKVKNFYDKNKLYTYEPQELADLILGVISDLYDNHLQDFHYGDNNWAQHFVYLWNCGHNLFNGLHKNITLQKAFEEITTAVYALSPVKYNDVMEELDQCESRRYYSNSKQEAFSEQECIEIDHQIELKTERKLNYIMKEYANKLVEKARSWQNVQKNNQNLR